MPAVVIYMKRDLALLSLRSLDEQDGPQRPHGGAGAAFVFLSSPTHVIACSPDVTVKPFDFTGRPSSS